jgi:quercetin dioxygenase-like cupin family protein
MSRLQKEATDCYSWSNGPGDIYAPHSHGYEKVLYCVDGSITFVLEAIGRRLELKAGDRMVLPAGDRPRGRGRPSRLHLRRRPTLAA